VLAALAPELARRPPEDREPLVEQGQRLIGLVEGELDAALPETERHGRATAIVSMMIGALQMSRVATEEAASLAILETAVQGGLAIGHRQ
jgi:hypothetical protein